MTQTARRRFLSWLTRDWPLKIPSLGGVARSAGVGILSLTSTHPSA